MNHDIVRRSQLKRLACVQQDTARGHHRPAFQKGNAVARKPIPGTIAAYSLLAASSLFVMGAFAGAVWLTSEGAIWLGHALPHAL